MSVIESNTAYEIYCKIPWTERTGYFKVPKNLTISEFLEYVDTHIRDYFMIDQTYNIEVVEVSDKKLNCASELAPMLEPRTDQTLEQAYGHIYNKNMSMAFYIRTVNRLPR